MREATAGTIEILGADLSGADLNTRVAAGLSFIAEERMRDGAIGDFTVQENIFLRDHGSTRFRRWIFLRFREMAKHAQRLVTDFAVKTPNLETPLKNLSGVDIGASEYIHRTLLAQRETGTAILLISEDLDEIRTLADRIAVIYNGAIVGVVDRADADAQLIGTLMAGGRREPTPQQTA